MSKLFQITEDDLAQLERDIPALVDRHMGCLSSADKTAIRRLQRIIIDVRWNYGPPQQVEKLEAGDGEGDE